MSVWVRAGYKLAAGAEDAKAMEAAGCKGVEVIEHNPEGGDRLTSDLVKAIRADKIKLVMELSGSFEDHFYMIRRGEPLSPAHRI